MRAMKRDDIEVFVRLHRQNSHATSAFDVAVAMLLYRRQLPPETKAPEVKPKHLQERLGISYDNARKALRRASDALDAMQIPSMQPDDKHPDDKHPTGWKASGSLPSGEPDDNRPVSPHPSYKDSKGVITAAVAHAREGSIPNGPSPEAEQREAVRFVGDVTAGALEGWASSACRIYPAAWVRALAERRCVGVQPPRAQYLNSILQAWARSGSCEYLDSPTVPLRPTGTSSGSPSAPIPYQSAAERRRAAQRAAIDAMEFPD